MTDKQKAAQENQRTPFDVTSCVAMMEKMMGQQECVCNCTGMMSQMMAMFGGVQSETEETTVGSGANSGD